MSIDWSLANSENDIENRCLFRAHILVYRKLKTILGMNKTISLSSVCYYLYSHVHVDCLISKEIMGYFWWTVYCGNTCDVKKVVGNWVSYLIIAKLLLDFHLLPISSLVYLDTVIQTVPTWTSKWQNSSKWCQFAQILAYGTLFWHMGQF